MNTYIRRLIDLLGRSVHRHNKDDDVTGPLNDNEKLWNQLLKAKGCVKCDLKPKGFIEGPSGGMYQNVLSPLALLAVAVFCSRCGQGYNLTPIAQYAELIHKDEKYIVKEEP